MKEINEIFALLDKPKKIAITTHQKPDADAMGSSLGLYNFLIQFGHQVTVVSQARGSHQGLGGGQQEGGGLRNAKAKGGSCA